MPIKSHKLLFFDLEVSGHHVEYLYHLIRYRIKHSECPEFVLLTHPGFIQRLSMLDLPDDWQEKGIILAHPSPEEMKILEKPRSVFSKTNVELKMLLAYAKKYDAKRCYLMVLNQFEFILGTDIARRFPCVLRGILFNPFPAIDVDGYFPQKCRIRATRFRKHIQTLWMLRNKKIDRIFVLNDPDSAEYLNNRYHKRKCFVALPDPILIPSRNIVPSVFDQDSDLSRRRRFLLFGALSSRKGIFLVLNALQLIPDQVAEQIEIVFAGKVIEEEYNQFRSAVAFFRMNKPTVKIVLQNTFIPFREVPCLFSKIDCVLMPYTVTGSSSGIIGHSALYGKPVIGPAWGLIGKLIRDYGLGIRLESVTASSIAIAIMEFVNRGFLPVDSEGMRRFVEERQPSRFVTELIAESVN